MANRCKTEQNKNKKERETEGEEEREGERKGSFPLESTSYRFEVWEYKFLQ